MDIKLSGCPGGLPSLAIFAVALSVSIPSYAAQEGTSIVARVAAQEGTSRLVRPAAQEGTSVVARPAAQEGTSIVARVAAQEGTSRAVPRNTSLGSVAASGFAHVAARRDVSCVSEELAGMYSNCP